MATAAPTSPTSASPSSLDLADGGPWPTEHRAGLDAVRGLAALAVVFVHVYQLYLLAGQDQWWGRAGDAGVSVFFVLSGYLISESVLRARRFDRNGFGLRRAVRILPAYWASLLIALVLVDASPLFTHDGRMDVLAHVFLLQGFFPGMRYSINGVWWTLTVELCFYVLMALVAGAFRSTRGGWAIALALLALGPLWRHLTWSSNPVDTAYHVQQLPGMADLFAAGMLLALAERTAAFQRLMTAVWARAAVALATLIWLPFVLWTYHQRQPTYWLNTRLLVLWPPALGLGVAGLILTIRLFPRASDAFARRTGLAFLGAISFGLYLVHPFVMHAFGQPWIDRNLTIMPVLPFVLLSVGGSIVVATGLHYLVELPGMRWGRTRATDSTVHEADHTHEDVLR